jgi:hypothetical protein
MADVRDNNVDNTAAVPIEEREDVVTNQTVSDRTVEAETPTSDPTVVRTTRSSSAVVADDGTAGSMRSAAVMRKERRKALRERYGGFYWGADLIGFATATFFTVLFLGIVGAIVGTVGYQLGAPVPKAGTITGTQQSLGIGALIGSLVALFLAYLIGGYTAGRMARYGGMKNGFGVVLWAVIAAAILGAAGKILGDKFNVAGQLHLNIDAQTLSVAGVVSLAVALAVMLLGALLGGILGERYHRDIDDEVRAMR